MATPIGPECSFLIPLRRDKYLSNGRVHHPKLWRWLQDEMLRRLPGGTRAGHTYEGWYRDPDTDEVVFDKLRKYFVALPRKDVPVLRRLLAEACIAFKQKCIYLCVGGIAELVTPDDQ